MPLYEVTFKLNEAVGCQRIEADCEQDAVDAAISDASQRDDNAVISGQWRWLRVREIQPSRINR